MSHQECLVLIAYLNFLTTLNGKCGNQIPRMANAQLKPHRTEKVGRSATHPRPKLTELLSDTTEDNASSEWDTGPAIGNEIW